MSWVLTGNWKNSAKPWFTNSQCVKVMPLPENITAWLTWQDAYIRVLHNWPWAYSPDWLAYTRQNQIYARRLDCANFAWLSGKQTQFWIAEWEIQIKKSSARIQRRESLKSPGIRKLITGVYQSHMGHPWRRSLPQRFHVALQCTPMPWRGFLANICGSLNSILQNGT